MDPEVEQILRQLKQANRAPFWQGTPAIARAGTSLMEVLLGVPEQAAALRIETLTIPSPDGHQIPARLYAPSDPKGLVLYFHGGGWVVGSAARYQSLTALLAIRTGCSVVSVDYRLAPEHPFPAPINDALAAVKWAAGDGAARAGAEHKALIAMGDSAGATLATVASGVHNLEATSRKVDLQVLAYPVTNHDFETQSYAEFAEGHLLTREDMKWFWNHYCADPQLRSNPLASPLLSADLAASPAALIVTAECDPLREEGEAYAQRLRESGVAVELLRAEGQVHGFLSMLDHVPRAAQAFDRMVTSIVACAQVYSTR